MLSGIIGKKTVYIVTGYTDMRKGIDGLAAIVQGKLSLDPYSKALFLFCGKNPRKLKGLLWEGDGFLLLSNDLKTENTAGRGMNMKLLNYPNSSSGGFSKGLKLNRKKQ